ncbi:MAG: glycoside hydrolase family 2 TIM barrel-domain containing protein [Bacteroidota bacterium]
MLRPRTGPHRLVLSLDGLWRLLPDPEDALGPDAPWRDDALAFAVPGSWNSQLAEAEAGGVRLAEYVGACWVGRQVFVPEAAEGKRVFVYDGSADYCAEVFWDSERVGESRAAFLPFWAEVTGHVTPGTAHRLALRVDNRATADTIPMGITGPEFAEPKERGAGAEHFPPARYDFFPYGGLHREVELAILPQAFIAQVRVETVLSGEVTVEIEIDGPADAAAARLADASGAPVTTARAKTVESTADLSSASSRTNVGDLDAEAQAVGSGTDDSDPALRSFAGAQDDTVGREELTMARLSLQVPEPCPWSPADPHLYTLRVGIERDGDELDAVELAVGIREVRVEGRHLLLNGEPVFLRGFGKHEDFPVIAKAHSPAVLVKDFGLMRWIGANSFRTSHYPYHPDWLDEADRRGVLVLSEVPAVSLNHSKTNEKTQAAHREAIRQLVARDRNHPSVIGWVIGNEPGLSGEEEATTDTATDYWQPLFDLTRDLDPSRPVTVPTHNRHVGRALYPLCDLASINRYYGWYTQPGQLDLAKQLLREELDEIWDTYGLPTLVTEFGADTLAGAHSTVPVQFTEEYQAAFIEAYLDVIEVHPAAVGAHIWNFADFRTPQNFRRVVDNLKGVFTRTRDPKRAAFALRARWTGARGPGMARLAHTPGHVPEADRPDPHAP